MPVSAEIAYLFRHALMREAAYQLHAPSARGVLHGLALEIMEELAESEHRTDAWSVELAEHAALACAAPGADRITLQSKELEYLERAAAHEKKQWHSKLAAELFTRVSEHPLADKHQRIEAMLEAISVLVSSGGLKQADRLRESALELGEQCGDEKLYAMTLTAAARVANSIPRLEDADRYGRKALRRAEHVKDRELQASALIERARTASALGKHRDTVRFAERAWKLMQDTGSPTKEARSRLYIADSLWQQGKVKEAAEHYGAIVATYEKTNELGGLAMAHDHLGSLLRALGDPDGALRSHEHAADLYGKVGDVLGQSSAINNIGNIYQQDGRLEDARRCYHQALKQIRNVGQAYLEGVTLGNLGGVNRRLGRLEEASLCLQNARDTLRRANRVIEFAVFDSLFGSLLLMLGLVEPALTNAKQSGKILEEAGAANWREQYSGLLEIRILVHRRLNGDPGAGREAEDRLTGLKRLLKKTGRVEDSGLAKSAEIAARLLEESKKETPLVFRGYLVDELEPALRLALIDRLKKYDTDEWGAIAASPSLLAAMREGTEGLETPDWENTGETE